MKNDIYSIETGTHGQAHKAQLSEHDEEMAARAVSSDLKNDGRADTLADDFKRCSHLLIFW